jgi:hypothetical protein
MGRFTEFREVLLMTWRKMAKPRVWIPAAVYFAIINGLSLGWLGTMLEMMKSPAGLERLAPNASLFMIVLVGVAVFAPAAVSGLASLGRAAVERETSGWRDVWQGLGTYYWRIVGFYVLACLAVVALAIPLGVYGLAAAARGVIEAALLPLRIIGLVPQYLVTPWLAIVALDGVGLFTSIGGAVRFAWTNPSLLVPAFVLEQVSTGIVNGISTGLFRVPRYGSVLAPFGSARFMGSVVAAAVSGYLFMFFILLYFGLYQLTRASVGPTAPSPVPGALPGEPGTPPPGRSHGLW